MKKLFCLIALVLFSRCAFSQTRAEVKLTASAHQVVLTWGASPDAGANSSLTYGIYRNAGVCPTGTPSGFTQVATGVTALTYTDSSITPGSFCYYVIAQLNGSQSAPSNLVVAAILPLPAGSLVVSSAQ